MANTNNTAKFTVDANQAIAALGNLQAKIGKTTDTFSQLRGALAGLAVTSFVANAYASANALTDMAKAAGISTQALLGFRDAVKANGGDAQAAVDSMGKFSQAIEGAAGGSLELQDKFLQLGITLKDLQNLSEEQLLSRVVEELGKGTAGAGTMATAMTFFGKSFKAVDFKGVAKDIRGTTEAAGEAAAGYESAGDAQQKFSNSIGKLQTELIKALTPISEVANNILDMGSAVKTFLRVAVEIGLVIASFTLLGKVISWGRVLLVGLAEGWGFISTAVSTVVNLFRNFGAVMSNLNAIGGPVTGTFKVLRGYFGDLGAWAVKSIPGIGALGAALLLLWEHIKEGQEWLGKLTGWWGDNAKASEDAAAKTSAAEKAKAEAAKQAAREVQDALQKQIKSIQQTSEEFSKANKRIIDNINLENQLVGASKAVSDVTKAQEEIFKRAADEADKLRDAKSKLSAEEKRRGLGAEYDKQIAKIQEVAAADAKRVETVLENQNRLEAADKLRLFGIQSQIDLSKKLQDVNDEMAKMGLTSIEKKYYDIEAATKASAKAAIEAEASRRGIKPEDMPTEEVNKYYEAAAKGADQLKEKTGVLYDDSRKFNTGWKEAFNDYVENATNAADQARRIFETFSRSMEDTLFTFFKTGKFEFKNFIQSMIDTLLRSQIQSLIAKTFSIGNMPQGTGAGGGGLIKSIGNLLGFANGGLIPTNGPVLVGERGPEILSGAGGRTVTPNEALGGGSVTYNISAVDAMSFKQMLAQDPTFLHAVAEQGRRRLPGSR